MTSKTGIENRAFEFEMSESQKKISDTNSPKIDKNANNAKLGGSVVDDNGSDFEEDENRCGFGCFSPDWIQPYATKRYFMAIFALLGVIQGMGWSYFSATISTLEKRFKMSSETTGIVMTGNEVSQIVFSLILSYYGGKGHRPRWIACGVLFGALACFILASPHLIYGSGMDALSLTEEYSYLAHKQDDSSDGVTHSPRTRNNNASMFGSLKKKVTLCNRLGNGHGDSCGSEEGNLAPLILIFLSQFVAGIGVLLFFTLGGPYLDDNTKRKNIPLVFGITMSLRLIGPTIGYGIAAGTLKLYINPLLTPYITSDDPRWQGAWWLGWIFFGTSMTVFSFFIALFPRTLKKGVKKGQVNKEPVKVETLPKLSDIPKAVKLLLKNKINVFNNLAGVFYLFSGIGYATYMPKYMETIFMQSASNASVISGGVGIFSQATGMILSGFLISRYQFSPRKLAGWNCFTAFLYVIVKISFTQIGCDVGKIAFGTEMPGGTWNLSSTCNEGCSCKISKILPVCHKEENTVYYSACHAGCTTFENNTIGNCSCISDPNATVTLGNCAEGCTQIFLLFLAITALIKFIDSTGRIGNMLVSYRCVSLEERSLSIGLHILLLSALALLPAPIVFGRIIDSVCLVWGVGSGCGKKGACMLYDGQQLRYLFNLTAAALTFTGGCFDLLVWYLAKDLELYKEPDDESCKDDKVLSPAGGGQQKEGIIKE